MLRGQLFSGGNWNNGSNAGAFAANWNYGRSNYNTNVGGRLANKNTARS